MITGFNTDVEHNGVVYHVQTEDKGLDSPLILSLVYAGGAILASKRSPYEDLIAAGFSDEALAERLKRQHRLICAAIRSGRIDDLKRMNSKESSKAAIAELSLEGTEELELEATDVDSESEAIRDRAAEHQTVQLLDENQVQQPAAKPADTTQDKRELDEDATLEGPRPSKEEVADSKPSGSTVSLENAPGLMLTLLDDDDEFSSGDERTLRVLVSERKGDTDQGLANASVSIKILGTTFRPLIYTVKTEQDGIATVSTRIPQFTSGRAAVLIRAVARDNSAELRRIIHPGR